MNPAKACAVLVPVGREPEPECERSLRELERRGYPVIRARGGAQIDYLRSQMASDFLREGFAETMWIDSDVGFNPDDVEKIRGHNLPLCAGIYARKGVLSLAVKVLPGTASLSFGMAGGLTEIMYASTGFLHVRRDVYEKIERELKLPLCNVGTGRRLVPYFLPMVAPIDGEPFYLSEDYSFCERARQAGFKIMADTTIRLWHIGSYHYGWEDAARPTTRHDAFVYSISSSSQGLPPAATG